MPHTQLRFGCTPCELTSSCAAVYARFSLFGPSTMTPHKASALVTALCARLIVLAPPCCDQCLGDLHLSHCVTIYLVVSVSTVCAFQTHFLCLTDTLLQFPRRRQYNWSCCTLIISCCVTLCSCNLDSRIMRCRTLHLPLHITTKLPQRATFSFSPFDAYASPIAALCFHRCRTPHPLPHSAIFRGRLLLFGLPHTLPHSAIPVVATIIIWAGLISYVRSSALCASNHPSVSTAHSDLMHPGPHFGHILDLHDATRSKNRFHGNATAVLQPHMHILCFMASHLQCPKENEIFTQNLPFFGRLPAAHLSLALTRRLCKRGPSKHRTIAAHILAQPFTLTTFDPQTCQLSAHTPYLTHLSSMIPCLIDNRPAVREQGTILQQRLHFRRFDFNISTVAHHLW